MARVYGIKKRLEKNNFDDEFIKEIIGNGDLIDITLRMEKLLDHDMMRQILESCGCLGGKEYLKQCEKVGKEMAGKALEEKLDTINNEDHDFYTMTLNDDNTLTIKMCFKGDGKYRCSCSAAVKNGVKVSDIALSDDRVMPLSYCFCCAGSSRLHLELKLGMKLKTKEIISSPINSKGEKPCSFIFEIIE